MNIGLGIGLGFGSSGAGNDPFELGPQGASLTLSGGAATLIAPMVAEGASLSLTGGAVNFSRELAPAGDALTLTGGAATLTPPVTNATYMSFSGNAGSKATVPDSNALDLTGDIEVRWAAALPDWTPAVQGLIVGKGLNYRVTVNTNGTMNFTIPGAFGFASSNPGFTDGQLYLVRMRFDADIGGTDSSCIFEYKSGVAVADIDTAINSTSGWTSINTHNRGAVTTPSANTSALEMGIVGSIILTGDVYRVQIYNGIGGTLVFDADPTVADPGDPSFTESSANAATVTMEGDSALV